jgi:hypothetical protein
MKKLISLTFLLALTIVISQAQNLKALDDKYGFRDYKFETDVNQFENLKLMEDEDEGLTKFYIKTDENLKIGDYDVETIAYFFYKDKLCGVILRVEGYINSKGILAALQELYGKGRKPNKYIETYFWHGNLVSLAYEQNSISDITAVSFYCNKIMKQKELDEKKIIKKATEDL